MPVGQGTAPLAQGGAHHIHDDGVALVVAHGGSSPSGTAFACRCRRYRDDRHRTPSTVARPAPVARSSATPLLRPVGPSPVPTRSAGGRGPAPSAPPARRGPAPRRPGPRRVPAVGHRAVLEHHGGAGDLQHPVDLLLDDEQRRSGAVDLPQPVVDRVDHHRGQTEGDLVGHQQSGWCDQHLGQRQHALLAPGQGPPVLAPALTEHREGGVRLLERAGDALAPAALAEGQPEVLLHREVGEDTPALGHVGRAGPGDLVRRKPGDVQAAQADGALGTGQQSGHHAGHGRLAGTVGADQGGDPAFRHVEGDVEQGPVRAVAGADTDDLQGRRRPPDRGRPGHAVTPR